MKKIILSALLFCAVGAQSARAQCWEGAYKEFVNYCSGGTNPAYSIKMKAPTLSGSWTFTLPSTSGTNLYPLVTDGSGITSWSILTVGGGGTGATSLTAHGVVVGNGTGIVNVTGAGTAGQVLTSNGASADPTFQAVAAAPTAPALNYSCHYEASGRYSTSTDATHGTATFGNSGLNITSTTGGTAYVQTLDEGNGGMAGGSGNLNILWSGNVHIFFGSTDTYDFFIGCSQGLGVNGSGINFAIYTHMGFKIIASGSGSSLYATQSDGGTETSSLLTTVANGNILELAFRYNASGSVDYWYSKNGGAWSSATNLSTHLPGSPTYAPHFEASWSSHGITTETADAIIGNQATTKW